MQRIKIVCTILCDAKITFNPEDMQPLSHVFCFNSKLILNPEKIESKLILSPEKIESFLLHILSHVFCRKSKAILNPLRYSIMEFQGVWKVTAMIIN
jgi:hypothetical protein